ncbi:MAG: aryl-sulfate sulfotransferase [Bacteroidota bacterium]
MFLRKLFTISLLGLLANLSTAQITVGLIQYDSTINHDGYTLIAPTTSNETYLIDACGREVHRWVGNGTPGLSVYLLENGQLLRTRRLSTPIFGAGGVGGGVELWNWEGDLLWKFDYASDLFHQHHDVEYLPNGHILIVAWDYRTREAAIAAGRDSLNLGSSFWPDHLIEIAPMGSDSAQIVWEWYAWDHLIQDHDSTKANYGNILEHPELIDVNFDGAINGNIPTARADWLHINAVQYNAELDQIVLSSRHFSEIWVIDHSTTTEEAASHSGGKYGKGGDLLYRWGNPQAYRRGGAADRTLYGQHDAHWIPADYPDGDQIMIFNNGIGRPGGSYSSVDIIEPPIDPSGQYTIDGEAAFAPENVAWTYFSPSLFDFYSRNISGAQRLPNGHTLICEGAHGRLFEIAPDGQILWEYINPVGINGPVSQGDQPPNNQLFRAYRYASDYPAFDGKVLEPGLPLELEPLPSPASCDSFIVSTTDLHTIPEWQLYPNPVQGQLTIEAQKGSTLEVLDFQGRSLERLRMRSTRQALDFSKWPAGMYWIRLNDQYIRKIMHLNP